MDIIVLELILVAVVVLGLGFWQLYDVNRELKNDCDDNRDNNRDNHSDNDHDEGTHATKDRRHDPAEDVDNAQDQ